MSTTYLEVRNQSSRAVPTTFFGYPTILLPLYPQMTADEQQMVVRGLRGALAAATSHNGAMHQAVP